MLGALVAAVLDRDERERKEAERWGYAEELLARIAELVHNLTLVTVDVNGKWASRRPDPLHIARPGEKPKNVLSMSEMARRMVRG